MMRCMITFRSVTPAQRGEGALKRKGISCNLGRTPKQLQEQGCGYSIHLSCNQIPEAVKIFRENGIAFRKVYMRRENGTVEEMSV